MPLTYNGVGTHTDDTRVRSRRNIFPFIGSSDGWYSPQSPLVWKKTVMNVKSQNDATPPPRQSRKKNVNIVRKGFTEQPCSPRLAILGAAKGTHCSWKYRGQTCFVKRPLPAQKETNLKTSSLVLGNNNNLHRRISELDVSITTGF